jgi:hypothetical protein
MAGNVNLDISRFQKKGIGISSDPLKRKLPINHPPTPQNLFFSASLLDDPEFHTISPPLLA